MIHIVSTALTRQGTALWQDALGGLSLVVILVGALHLPLI